MAMTYTTSFVAELCEGTHVLSTDVLKLALFSSSASPGASTTAYSVTNEVSGTGYTAGGKTATITSGYPQTAPNGVGRMFRFDDVEWASASFTARWGLLYNSSKSNKAVMVIDFGQNRTAIASTFAVRFPLTQSPIIRVG